MPLRSLRVKIALVCSILLAAAGTALWFTHSPVPTPEPDPTLDPEGRVAAARIRRGATVTDRFRQAGVSYPPRELFLRAFKHEAQLEAWARSDAETFTLIHTYPITYSSGKPGPKRREGDRQVPEGFYQIDRFNPLSLYHLSLRVNYPNASDHILSDREKPGFDIYLHGGDGSVGCLPLGDDGIEELYLMALDAGNRGAIPIHIFPARMSGPAWEEFATPLRWNDPGLASFWETLQPGFDAFEHGHRPPTIVVQKDGRYRITATP